MEEPVAGPEGGKKGVDVLEVAVDDVRRGGHHQPERPKREKMRVFWFHRICVHLVRQAKPGFSIDLKRDQHVK